MKKTLIIGIVFIVLVAVLVSSQTTDDLLARIIALERRVQHLEETLNITPPCIESWSCTDWSECTQQGGIGIGLYRCNETTRTCIELTSPFNYIQTRTCTDLSDCGTEEYKPIGNQTCTPDLCNDVVCNSSELVCPDGFISTCENYCDNNTGLCSNCTPDCTGHEQISYEEKVYNLKVSLGNNDVFERSNRMYISDPTVVIGRGYSGGFRFTNIQLPSESIIEEATLSLAFNWASSSSVNILLYGEDSNNPIEFSLTSSDITDRTRTTSMITWQNLGRTGWGQYQTSPNISSIIQEIITRPNWQSGNPIVILGYPLDNRIWEAISYEGTSWSPGLYSATLEIKALVPSTPINNTPPPNPPPSPNNQTNLSNNSKIIIVQMDDASPQWGQDMTIEVVQAFMDNQMDFVIDLFPSGLTTNPSYANQVGIWQASEYIEVGQGTDAVATGSLSYSELVNNLNNGATEFANAGLQKPQTVTCHISNGDTNTLDAIRDTGYDSFACLLEGPYRDNNPFTTGSGYGSERHGEFILRDWGMMGTNQPIKTSDEFRTAADEMIARRGYAYFVGHFADFTTERINYLINQLNVLRNEGYEFMTVKEYYQKVKNR